MALPHPEFDHYRLVLISSPSGHILLEKIAGRLALPQIPVPRWTRAAQKVASRIRERWNFRAWVLDFLGDHPGRENLVIAERIDEQQKLLDDANIVWRPLHAVPEGELSETERAIIRALVDKGSTERGPFSRLGWAEDLLTWSSKVLNVARSQLSDEFVQLNAAADSALVHILTHGGSRYWFKAAGASHPHERRVTVTLSQELPEYLPELIAVHEQWNGWLMRDAGVPFLASYDPSRLAVEAVRRLARLQAEASPIAGRLLLDGCHDHRMPVLRAQIPELTPYLEEAMREPGTELGSSVGPARLRRIAALIAEATLRAEDMGIPNTLMHCDISFDNILVGSRGCTFIDWAQASIGHPFITLEHLCAQFAQHENSRTVIPRLRKTYLNVWQASLSGRYHRQALTFMPLVALASLLCCRSEWLTGSERRLPSSHSYARVLARQLDLAARQIEEPVVLAPGFKSSIMRAGETEEEGRRAAARS
jgi:hypothetical protein